MSFPPFVRGTVVSIVLVGVLPALATGQEPDSTRAPGQPIDTAAVIPLPPVVVTATRTPVRADRVGFALSVIGQGELEVERPFRPFDALEDVPGAFVDRSNGPGGPTIVRLRGGEEVFTQILMDGVQVNENGGFFDFQGMELSNLQRIEVARGPQSAVYGSSAMSGVVQFVTPRGQAGPPRTEISLEGGNAIENGGRFRGTGRVAGGGGELLYSAGAGVAYDRGVYDVAHDTWSWDGSLRLDWAPADRWDVTAIGRLVSFQGNLPVRDAGATRVPLDPNQRNERDRVATSVEARFAATPSWDHRLRASLFWQEFLYEDSTDMLPETEFFVPNFNISYASRFLRPSFEYSGTYRIAVEGDQPVSLTYGALWEREDAEDELGRDFTGTTAFDRDGWAAFAEVLLPAIPRTDLLVGARLENTEGLDSRITPRASAVVAVVPQRLWIRGAWGEAFKAPNLQEQFSDNPFIRGNPDLEPETSDSWEMGFDVRNGSGRMSLGLTWFDQRFEDLIRTVRPEGEDRSLHVNLGASAVRGLEWRARYLPSEGWLLGSDGAWIETEILENEGLPSTQYPQGEELPFRPDVTGSVFTQVRPSDRVTLLLRGSYVGEQTVLTERFSGNREEIDGYFLLGFTGHYRYREGMTLYTRIENLLDTEYRTAFDRPGIPARISLGFEYSR